MACLILAFALPNKKLQLQQKQAAKQLKPKKKMCYELGHDFLINFHNPNKTDIPGALLHSPDL